MDCPFCQNFGAELFHQDDVREFFKCLTCTIIFVPRSALISLSEEKKRYDSHQNAESDPEYRRYFLQTVNPVVAQVPKKGHGLDFGCGKTRLMEKLFMECGIEVDSYDPFYFPDESIWKKNYDFAVLNEVIEHLNEPAKTLTLLKNIIKGPIFVRTKLYPESEPQFAKWFYKRDITHVQFFSLKALSVLGEVKELGTDLYRIDWK